VSGCTSNVGCPPGSRGPPGDALGPAQRAVFDAMVSGPRGTAQGQAPIRAAIHNPEPAERRQYFGALLRYGTVRAPRVSQPTIMVTAPLGQPSAVDLHFFSRGQGGCAARGLRRRAAGLGVKAP
jgi:hypothetical protein